jgi:isoleucyl-tRNA synthetase
MLSPILSFTAEEAWQCLRSIDGSLPESVFLSSWPEIDRELEDPSLEEKWQRILTVRGAVSKVLEEARSKGLIGQSLEASVGIERAEEFEDMASLDGALWEMVCIVSRFEWVEGAVAGDVIGRDEDTGLVIGVSRAPGGKCHRCWKYSTYLSPDGLCPRCEAVLESLSSSRT